MTIGSQALATQTITAAGTAVVDIGLLPAGTKHISIHSNFTYGSGGTTAKFYLQSSFDGGTTWVDHVNLAHTTASLRRIVSLDLKTGVAIATATDATLADNSKLESVMGDRIRLKYVSVGTYAGGTTMDMQLFFR